MYSWRMLRARGAARTGVALANITPDTLRMHRLSPSGHAHLRPRAALLLVDHLSGHAAVDHETGSGHETRSVAIEEKGGHFRDVLGPAHASCRMLEMVLAPQLLFLLTSHDDPAGADAVHPHLGSEADRQGVGQRHEPALAGRIGFGVRLGHQRAG